jgi:membrane-associated phospholipid phosphatase
VTIVEAMRRSGPARREWLTVPTFGGSLSVMSRKSLVLAFGLLPLAAPAHASDGGWETASDIGRGGLVIVALGLPTVQGDWQGTKQAAFSIGSTALVTTGIKEVVSAERPDRSDDESFPSGHTSTSFAAAATIHKRHGWEVGIPAHIVAAFVGVARVKADKHFVRDVVAGAAIGEVAGWILTRRRSEKVQWFPWGDTRGGGVALAVRL